MFVRFRCPKCHAGLKAPPTRRGDVIECPGCTQVVRIPGEKPPDAHVDSTIDYVSLDEEAQPLEQPAPADEPASDSPRVKKKRRRRVAVSGVGRAAPWLVGVLVSLALSVVLCGGMIGWAYYAGKPRAKGAPVVIAATLLAKEYADNPKVAAKRYEGGTGVLEVTGTVRSVSADDAEDPQLVLDGSADGKPPWVRCLFDPQKQDVRAQLRKVKVGDTVTVRGECDGRHGDYIDLGVGELVP
jgi:hypothetical protein